MTTIKNEELFEKYRSITENISSLKSQRSQVSRSLRSAGLAADKEIESELEVELNKAKRVVQGLSVSLESAERHRAALDKRIDAGDETVTPLEVVEADMAVRTTKGKQKPADAALRKAERALTPFHADNHLSQLAADTIEGLVDVPVLIQKRPADVKGIKDAVILSQPEPTTGYGTVDVSGTVGVTLLGSTDFDVEALKVALEATGSDVSVGKSYIEFHSAMWPQPHLEEPSVRAVTQFANALERTFAGVLKSGKRAGRDGTSSWAYYNARWQTLEASLEVVDQGLARGKIVAIFGVEGERPPLSQMQSFIALALGHFNTGVHTSAGVLDKITVEDIKDTGSWLHDGAGEAFIANRMYTQKFGLSLSLNFSYVPVGGEAR